MNMLIETSAPTSMCACCRVLPGETAVASAVFAYRNIAHAQICVKLLIFLEQTPIRLSHENVPKNWCSVNVCILHIICSLKLLLYGTPEWLNSSHDSAWPCFCCNIHEGSGHSSIQCMCCVILLKSPS